MQEILSRCRDSFPYKVGVQMDGRENPYTERGKRLRRRREELQASGRLPSLKALARELGVTSSVILQWERGETWPTPKNKAKLAERIGWTIQELDYGPGIVRKEGHDMLHPVNTQEMVLLALFGKLPKARRSELIEQLKVEALSIDAVQAELKGDLKPVPDAVVRPPVKAGRRSKQ